MGTTKLYWKNVNVLNNSLHEKRLQNKHNNVLNKYRRTEECIKDWSKQATTAGLFILSWT